MRICIIGLDDTTTACVLYHLHKTMRLSFVKESTKAHYSHLDELQFNNMKVPKLEQFYINQKESKGKPNPRPLFGKNPNDVFRKHKRRFSSHAKT